MTIYSVVMEKFHNGQFIWYRKSGWAWSSSVILIFVLFTTSETFPLGTSELSIG